MKKKHNPVGFTLFLGYATVTPQFPIFCVYCTPEPSAQLQDIFLTRDHQGPSMSN